MNPNEPPKDHVDDDSFYGAMNLDDPVQAKASWQRLLFMLIFAMLFGLGVSVGSVVVVLQFFWVLFTGEPKPELAAVGRQLAEYGSQIVLYMSFNTEERPFPFDLPWPSARGL